MIKNKVEAMQIKYTGIQDLMNRDFESNFKIWQPQRDENEGKVYVHICMYVCVCVYGCVHMCICNFGEKNATSTHLTI